MTNDKKFLILSVCSSKGLLMQKEKFMVFEYGTWKHLYTTPKLDRFVFKTYSLDSVILCTSSRLLADKKVYQIYPYSKKTYHDKYRYGFTDYNNLRANFSLHSDSEFEVVTPNPPTLTDYNNIVTRTFVAGTDAATSAFYIGAADPMPANVFMLKAI